MFITTKRHEREKKQLIAASNRLTEVFLKSVSQGLFVLDSQDKIQPQVSKSLATLFRRQDFTNLSFEKLLGPVVSAKTLSAARNFMARLRAAGLPLEDEDAHPMREVEIRLRNPDGSHETAYYSFEFNPVDLAGEPRVWLVRVTDITARSRENRELADLRTHLQTQNEILRGILQGGGARFSAFLQRTAASMKAINGVLKKPSREAAAFRHKLAETLEKVERVRRDAATLKLTGLEAAARQLEDSLQDIRSRDSLSGADFLPLAVKLDRLYGQFASIRQITSQAAGSREPHDAPADSRRTNRRAQAGSLESTLLSLTELVAQEHRKTVTLQCVGMQLVPPRYQATIKNVALQLIRNAVMHGIESSAVRLSAGKAAHGSLHLEFRALANESFELDFQDDGCGLDPQTVRDVAVARGIITQAAAAKLRDRQAIKLIFKSGFSTLASAPGETPHGTGLSLVRRYVNEAGGKIALASLTAHETRFKVTLPPVELADAAAVRSELV
ncbi:MAG: ATP-binding protein [Pseudomonadota bacterium]|nr:ATP-binding protein [Pseudomonadota bacterium]